MRLCRHSIFCTGSKTTTQRNGLGTNIDPFINLCTLNYILACIQTNIRANEHYSTNLWWEFLYNLDKAKWPKDQTHRDYTTDPLNFSDLEHLVHNCIKPFGIVRGSERQGGQNEISLGPATWPTSFVTTLVIDGKEANVTNIWHNQPVNANDDLVLRFMPKRCGLYTLNHYYKGYASKTVLDPAWDEPPFVWQLVPDVYHLDLDKNDYFPVTESLSHFFQTFYNYEIFQTDRKVQKSTMAPWQGLGFWHIGRSQVMIHQYGIDDFYKDDMANNMRGHHLQMTFQPVYSVTEYDWQGSKSPTCC